MRTRLAVLLAAVASLGICGDWSPKLAAEFLDGRQKAWLEWPTALKNGAACISCHTNLVYLLARPALSHRLQESGPAEYEGKLLDSLRKGLAKRTPAELASLGVESIMAALLLTSDDARRGVFGPDSEQAFERMWALQIASGENKGGWNWFSLDLDPWEEPASAYFGASLAALAVGTAPAEYRSRENIRTNLDALKAYLDAARARQPLHNRLVLLWASGKWRELLSDTERKAIAAEAIAKQRDDGGWSIQSLGPWKEHPNAPPSQGSNAYATALTAFTLQEGGVARSDAKLQRALAWLRSHQAPSGYWDATSMNKRFEAGSMQEQFMRDAATGFASLALAGQ